VAELLSQGLRMIAEEQLSNGEVPNYQCMADQSWQYCFSPLVSAYVYEALSCFDPQSARFEAQAAERLELARRMPFLRLVAHIRQRIRRFLAWQESSTGGWRFFGQGSGLPPDLDLTACAATVFIDPNPLPLNPSTYRRMRDLEQFRTADGTFSAPGSRDETHPDPALLWMANCNVLRYLALTGGETAKLEAAILHALASVAVPPSDALPLLYAAARAWRHGQLDSLSTLTSYLLPLATVPQNSSRGPLSAALTVLILLELDAPPEELDQAVDPLLTWWDSPFSRKFETFCDSRCGSPALTAALTMAAAARAGIARDAAL
jgi:hypothetical protein